MSDDMMEDEEYDLQMALALSMQVCLRLSLRVIWADWNEFWCLQLSWAVPGLLDCMFDT